MSQTNQASSLNAALTEAVAAAGASVVRVSSGRRQTSGIVFREPNLVITASHAIRHDEGLRVTTEDGESYDAEVVGRHRGSDLALLRVANATLSPLEFRAPDDVQTGNLTLALARPGRAVRASLRIVGVVSGEVNTPFGGRLDRYIETDRGLPPGFAGGPLIDLDGKGIGMNTDGILREADIAVPQPTLERVVDAIVRDGGVKRGYLGIAARPVRLPEQIEDEVGQRRGALVIAVEKGSAAEASGLVLGDVFLSIADTPITGPRSLAGALRDRVNEKTPIRILRAGQSQSLEITTGERL